MTESAQWADSMKIYILEETSHQTPNVFVCLFHRIGPLGRFDLVVAMSVCVSVCPLPMRFFGVRELVHASLVRGLVHASVALAWSHKNGEVFRIGRVIDRF